MSGARTHIYFTGIGRFPSPSTGTSSVTRSEEYSPGMSDSEVCFAGVGGMFTLARVPSDSIAIRMQVEQRLLQGGPERDREAWAASIELGLRQLFGRRTEFLGSKVGKYQVQRKVVRGSFPTARSDKFPSA